MKRLLLSSLLFISLLLPLSMFEQRVAAEEAIEIDGCQNLSDAGATYLLTEDLTAGDTCFTFAADNITLDGNGHSVTGQDGQYGVYLSGRSGVTVKNLVLEYFIYGIYLVNSSDNSIVGNAISSGDFGIGIKSSSGNVVADNTSAGNTYQGISLHSSHENRLTGNTTRDNGDTGIVAYSSLDNVLEENIASENETGIALFFSVRTSLADNLISGNTERGLYLFESDRNTLSGNTFTNNSFGVYLSRSNDNEFFLNNYAQNPLGHAIVFSGEGNLFSTDRPEGGNYWDSYDQPDEGCTNLNQDTFCDDPLVTFFYTDKYPWQTEDGWVSLINSPPLAVASPVQPIDEGEILVLSGADSTDPFDDELTASWTISDETYSESVVVLTPRTSRVVRDDFSGVATLTVTDTSGLSDSASISITVLNVEPVLKIVGLPSIDEGGAFRGSGSFSDPGADTWTVTVDYGDGSNLAYPSISSEKSFALSHSFPDSGEFVVIVLVCDDDNGCDTAFHDFTVRNVTPTIAEISDAVINESDTFIASGSFSDPGADSWTATVNYGDGFGDQPLVLRDDNTFGLDHTYMDDGAYEVLVSVSDDDQGVSTIGLVVNVQNVAPTLQPIANVHTLVSEPVSISTTFSDPGLIDTFVTSIDWGDSSVTRGSLSGSRERPTITDSHTYLLPGTYTATVTVEDDDGGVATQSFEATVLGAQDLSQRAIDSLSQYAGVSRRIDTAIQQIRSNLSASLWLDASHLNPLLERGVFIRDRHVMASLGRVSLIGPRGAGLEAIDAAIDDLVTSERLISATLVLEAANSPPANPVFQDAYDKQLQNAYEELDRGLQDQAAGNFESAINHYRKAMNHAQQAGKLAATQ